MATLGCHLETVPGLILDELISRGGCHALHDCWLKVSTIFHRTCCQFFYEYCEKGSNVHLSSSLYGPWRPLAGTNLYCNNPSPWKHTNGSLYLLCSHQGLELSTNLREFSQLEAFTPGTVKLSEGSLTALPGRLPIKIC